MVAPYVGPYLMWTAFMSLPEFLVTKSLRDSARDYVEKGIKESKS